MSERLKELLEAHHEWPTRYTFKFIVGVKHIHEVLALFPDEPSEQRPSRENKYVSIQFRPVMDTAQDVLDVYEKAARIPGIVSL